ATRPRRSPTRACRAATCASRRSCRLRPPHPRARHRRRVRSARCAPRPRRWRLRTRGAMRSARTSASWMTPSSPSFAAPSRRSAARARSRSSAAGARRSWRSTRTTGCRRTAPSRTCAATRCSRASTSCSPPAACARPAGASRSSPPHERAPHRGAGVRRRLEPAGDPRHAARRAGGDRRGGGGVRQAGRARARTCAAGRRPDRELPARRLPRPRRARRRARRLGRRPRRPARRARRLHGAAIARVPRALPARRRQRPPGAAAFVPRPRRGRAGARARGEGLRRHRALRRRGRRHRADHPPARAGAAPRALVPRGPRQAARRRARAAAGGDPADCARSGADRPGEPAPRPDRAVAILAHRMSDATETANTEPLTAPGEVQVRRALLSVSDKTGVVDFARGLAELGVELVSTGGTAGALADAGIPHRSITDYTGFPEIMDGRVKTLNPKLYAGLLAVRDNAEHLAAAADADVEFVDLVCVNLYPFEQTVAKRGVADAEVIENIDIGGPTMIRAAAKNFAFTAPVVSPASYDAILDELRTDAGACRLSLATRESLAAEAFAYTARYDTAIARWFSERRDDFPPLFVRAFEKVTDLSYGENPHQRAAYYAQVGSPTHLLSNVRQLGGKPLSFNNLLDLNATRMLVREFGGPACVIVKHNNPCGVALGDDGLDAYRKA